MSLSDYFITHIGDDAYYEEFGKSDKIKGYVSALKRLKPIYEPTDLKRYVDIPTGDGQSAYFTQNHVQGIKHLFTYMEKYHNMTEFNGYPIAQWRKFFGDMNSQVGQHRSKEERMRGHDVTIDTHDVKEWYKYLRDDMKPWYILLLYSGARETHLYAALSDPNKKIKRVGGVGATGKWSKLEREILYLDARGSVSENGKNKKLEFAFMFPVELENVVRNYLPPIKEASTRKKQLTDFPRTNGAPAELKKVGAANTRKWTLNILQSTGKITSDELDNIQGRGLGSVQNTHYQDMEYKVANAYAKGVGEMLEALPIPKEWNEALPKSKPKPNPKKPIHKNPHTAEVLKLHKKGMSARKIADEIGIHRNTVNSILKIEGVT